MKLLIDDKRDMPDGCIARDYEAGNKMLLVGGWDTLYIDHDLGDGKTGYDLIVKFSRVHDDFDDLPDKIVIVSSNPVGRENIAAVLVNIGFKRLGQTFTRNPK